MKGYAKMSLIMGAFPEVAIFRRFASLNVQNLLYLQAELVYLEKKLRRLEEEHEKSGDGICSKWDIDWEKLSDWSDCPSNGQAPSPISDVKTLVDGQIPSISATKLRKERWNLILKVKKKLEKYNEALLMQATLSQLKKPLRRDLKFLQEWMDRTDLGGVVLDSLDSDVWENPDHRDLVALKPAESSSLLSTWLSNSILYWYHQNIAFKLKKLLKRYHSRDAESGQEEKTLGTRDSDGISETDGSKPIMLDSIAQHSNTTYHSATTLLRISRILAVTLASLLPVGATVVLYSVENMPQRLGVIAVFTTLFSLALGLTTNGELIDVFAASAAFAAVQVVFVGGTS